MPRMPERYRDDGLALSVGGSVLFSKENPHLNIDFTKELMDFLHNQTVRNRAITIVVGGGILARMRQSDARKLNVSDPVQLDRIGIRVTQANALDLFDIFHANEIPAVYHASETPLKSGYVYFDGGNDTGHTTDFVAVQAAIQNNLNTVFNISTVPGIFQFTNHGFNKSHVLTSISFDAYLPHVKKHEPGINTPFDYEATQLAKEHDMTVIFLGPDLKNLANCMNGKQFVGTVMHP